MLFAGSSYGDIIFFLINLQAESGIFTSGESFICPDNAFVYRGIHCCLDSVSQNLCQELINNHINIETFEQITKVQDHFRNETYGYAQAPNCFWNVYEWTQKSQEEPFFMSTLNFLNWLNTTATEQVPLPLSQTGDIILFWGAGQIREISEENGQVRSQWMPYRLLLHSAIFLENGYIFQKENLGSDVFSITSLSQSQKAYKKGFNRPPTRGEIEIEVLRAQINN